MSKSKFIIRTLECPRCGRFDSIELSETQLFELIDNNDLKIGSKRVFHKDHVRVIYFNEFGEYLGDTILKIPTQQLVEELLETKAFSSKESVLSKIKKRIVSMFLGKEVTISITGPSFAGKTSLTTYLSTGVPLKKLDDYDSLPTMGKSIKELKIGSVKVTLHDLGGQPEFWPEWVESLISSDAIIFVLDGSGFKDNDQLEALEFLLKANESQKKPLLILLNKVDVYLRDQTSDFIRARDLYEFLNSKEIKIIEASVLEGKGYAFESESYLEKDLIALIHDFLKTL